LLKTKSHDYASFYAGKEPSALKRIEELTKFFEAMAD
jgi:hypothetical protein